MYRIPDENNWPHKYLNSVINDDALNALKRIPDDCISLIVTSPPYWDVVDYEIKGQIGHTSYEQYIQDLLAISATKTQI